MHAGNHIGNRQRQRAAGVVAVELVHRFSGVTGKHISPGKHGVDRCPVEQPRTTTGGIEQLLQLVRDRLQRDELHRAGVAFKGVEGAKHGGQRIAVVG